MTFKGIKEGTSYAPCDYMSANSDRPLGFAYAGDPVFAAGHTRAFGTKHFKPSEFECHHCHEIHPDGMAPELYEALEELREALGGAAIRIMSGYRCPTHNTNVGGARQSQHVAGRAADLIVTGVAPRVVANAAVKVDAFKRGGVGRYPGFTHVDVRGDYGMRKARWGKN